MRVKRITNEMLRLTSEGVMGERMLSEANVESKFCRYASSGELHFLDSLAKT